VSAIFSNELKTYTNFDERDCIKKVLFLSMLFPNYIPIVLGTKQYLFKDSKKKNYFQITYFFMLLIYFLVKVYN
jgi:hypothetical protein